MSEFRCELKKYRTAKGLTQEELADMVDVEDISAFGSVGATRVYSKLA